MWPPLKKTKYMAGERFFRIFVVVALKSIAYINGIGKRGMENSAVPVAQDSIIPQHYGMPPKSPHCMA